MANIKKIEGKTGTAPQITVTTVKAKPPDGGGCLATDSDRVARGIWKYPLYIFTFEDSIQMCEKLLTLPKYADVFQILAPSHSLCPATQMSPERNLRAHFLFFALQAITRVTISFPPAEMLSVSPATFSVNEKAVPII